MSIHRLPGRKDAVRLENIEQRDFMALTAWWRVR
jgi:hypothetical protein